MMKNALILIFSLLLIVNGCQKKAQEQASEEKKVETKKQGEFSKDIEVISYRMGFDTTITTMQTFPELDPDAICRGVKDAVNKPVEPQYSDEVFNRSMAKIRKNKVKVDAEKRLSEYVKNQPVSEKYMAEIAKKEGLKKLSDGVFLEVLKEGSGDKITMKDIAVVKYQGWDAKGKLFDSSFKRNRNSKFNLHNLIQGLQTAMLEMKKGGKYKVYIPEKAGYGAKGFRNRVEAGMALLFEVEMVDVEIGKAKDPGNEKIDPNELMKKMENKNDSVKEN
jgi:FKBP-type peptidyl-prolyl cis-trans isomerase FkpA